MPDRDFTPTPGRPSARGQGRMVVPDDGDRVESADPPTVRSGSPAGSKSSGSAEQRTKLKFPNVAGLPVPGERIGDFGLEEAIGAGGMGAVFRAVDIKLDRQVALKILPPDQAVDTEVVQRYYQEGRAAARLDHENIARVYSIGHDGPYHFICFEYIEGTTIRQRVESGGPLAVDDAINYTLQIANALVHAAERGVVHRDIKPSNIIVTPQGRAKLVDMGLARRFERGQDTGLTQSGMTLGTFDYISPEQARDPRDVDVRGDLYSLGCTLFHMLSGRPPFPEGTVLQKLIQHQEEPPPDVRRLNPSVPDDLASILVKLMAKDRDRRYQTPELLVRDLLTVAGALGLRSINPEGLVWMAPKPVPAWTRHVVWGVPALVFLLVMGGLAWWGDGPSVALDPPTIPFASPIRSDIPSAKSEKIPPSVPEPQLPVERSVGARDNLIQVVLDSPPRSTFVLSEKGPYELRGLKAEALKGLEFTIKAETGVRPLIRFPRDAGGGQPFSALVDFVGGRVTLEGLDFLVDRPEAIAAIRAEQTDLIIRRCSFRRSVGETLRNPAAAIAIKAAPRASASSTVDRPVLLSVEASEFDGGQVAIRATGAVDVGLRDCTFGPASIDQANVWLDNPDARSLPSELGISHLSVLAGSGPVFRFEGTLPRVRVSNSAFAPPSVNSPAATLVAIDSAAKLDWRGIDNLYGSFGTFLQRPTKLGPKATLATFAAWVDDPSAFRESGSIAVDRPVWDEPNPLAALTATPTGQGPTRAFKLAVPRQAPPSLGARQGPLGVLPSPVLLASASPTAPKPAPAEVATPPKAAEVSATPAKVQERADEAGEIREMPIALPTDRTSQAAKNDEADAPVVVNDQGMVPMPVDPERPLTPPVGVMPPAIANPRPEPAGPVAPALPEPKVIRTVEEFREATHRPVPGPKVLILASDANLVVPALSIRATPSVVIKGDRGVGRPRLRFRGEAVPTLSSLLPAIAGSLPDPWTSWFTLQAGSLRLEGIDLVVTETEKPTRRRAAFAVAHGSNDLNLTDCSVTIEGDALPSAVVALLPGEAVGEVRLRFKDCLLRSGGDLVDVAAGRRLDLDIDNALIATGGTLLHIHGVPEARLVDPIKLGLRQVTAKLLGGLAHLQSTPDDPKLPVMEIKARDSIVTTGDADNPLLRVDGQGNIEDLRPLIRWEGRSIAYHLINLYRRDQSAQPGAVPTLYDRDFWNFKLNRQEESPLHGDLKFLNEAALSRSPWTLRPDDVRLSPDSPAISLGSDLSHIPSPANR